MLAGQVLLALSAAALAAAAWRLAGPLTAQPLERALAAAPLAGAAAVAGALLLGRVDLAGEPLALAGVAVAAWVVAAVALPVVAGRPLVLSTAERWALGAAAGALLALVAWMLRHPAVGVDGITYHLPEALAWVQAGDTGSTPAGAVEFHPGSYPLTNEVLLAWGLGVSGTFAAVELWVGAVVALFALAGWVGLRRLGCGRGLTALALAAVLAEPVLAQHLNTPKNDLPALAWLAACAALCACAAPRAREAARPALLGAALVAAGLAVGSKTTTAPLALIVLLAGLWACRGSLGRARTPLALGLLGALAVGGVWYLRNLIAHGWFFWPFGSGPFGGDPEPVYLERIHVSFLERPRASLRDGRADIYVELIRGGLVLVAGGVAAALTQARSRLVLGASAATAVAALAWMAAPFTGRADNPVLDLSLTTTRYLLPVFAAGAVALALAGRRSRAARVVLAAALVWNVFGTLDLGFPDVPPAWVLLVGAAAGAVLLRTRLTIAVALAGLLVFSARAADGWLERGADTHATANAPVQQFFAGLPGWSESREPVAFWPVMVGPVAGDRLRHPIELIVGLESCTAIRARARRGWVVIRELPDEVRELLAPTNAPDCFADLPPVARVGDWLIYRQIATMSSAVSRPSAPSVKSAAPIAASSGD